MCEWERGTTSGILGGAGGVGGGVVGITVSIGDGVSGVIVTTGVGATGGGVIGEGAGAGVWFRGGIIFIYKFK